MKKIFLSIIVIGIFGICNAQEITKLNNFRKTIKSMQKFQVYKRCII
jgi:hypothetical protein